MKPWGDSRRSRVELVILSTGTALRLAQLLRGRALWLDEAWLALNVLTRPLSGFFRPLDNQQISSLGFLSAEWFVTRLAGAGEVAFRLIPFIAGVLALFAFARLARRMLDPGPALVATALAALSPLLLHYSAETKSYGLDALMAILLMYATLDLAEQGATRQAVLRWTLVAAVTALVSVPAPFIVGGCALALLVNPRFRSAPGALVGLALACAPAACCFLLQLLTLYHSQATTLSMQRYWADSFAELSLSGVIKGAALAARRLLDPMLFGAHPLNGTPVLPLPHKSVAVLLVLAFAGAVSLARRASFHLVLLLAPNLLAFCASLARYWPLSTRLLMFAVPAVLITVPAGLKAVAQLAPEKARAPVFVGLAVILLSLTGIAAGAKLLRPPSLLGVRGAMAHIGARHGKDATVYVAAYLVPTCTYYSAWHPDRRRLVGDSAARECSVRGGRMVLGTWPHGRMTEWVAEESRRILDGPSGEVWLVLHAPEFEVLSAAVDSAGAVRVAETHGGNISIYQYRTRPSSAPLLPQP